MSEQHDRHIIIGKITGIYGVQGWVRILSYTRPKENIFSYSSWLINRNNQWDEFELSSGKIQGKRLVAQLGDVTDRDMACELINAEIAVYREQLPEIGDQQFYWCDLIGLEVVNQQNEVLGKIIEIIENPANDVLVVQGEQRWLIPYIRDIYVIGVDLNQERIVVDWKVDADVED